MVAKEQYDIELITPFPQDAWPKVWDWMQEYPEANFDDYGPKTLEEFEVEMKSRSKYELIYGVKIAHCLCGIIALLPVALDGRLWQTHGICFAKEFHKSGIPYVAIKQVINKLFQAKGEKISAAFFATNKRVAKFLYNLGFAYEGTLKKHTLQHRKPIDMIQMALFKESF